MIRKRSIRALLLLGAALFLFVLVPPGPAARADIVHTDSGGRIEGSIVYEDSELVKIKTRVGIQTVPRDRIVKIDRVKTPAQEFDEKLTLLVGADDLYRLGLWAREQGLTEDASKAFRKALTYDAEHEGARKELGYVKHEGKWLDADEYNRALGKVKVGDRWVSKEEAEEAERTAGAVKRDKALQDMEARRKAFVGVPWAQGTEKSGHVVKTQHYKLKCNATPELAREYADFMELLHEKYSNVFGAFEMFPPDTWDGKDQGEPYRMNVFITRNHQEFMTMLQKPEGIGGYYMFVAAYGLPARIVAAFHGSFGGSGNTFTVLAHEGTHQFEHLVLKGDFAKKPIWLLEGMACWFGDGYRLVYDKAKKRNKIAIGDPQDRLGQLLREYQQGQYLKVAEVIRTPQRAFGGRHYAYGWAIIDFLVNADSPTNTYKGTGDKKKLVFDKFPEGKSGREVFTQYFRANVGAEASPEDFEKMIGYDIGQFDDDVKAFILSKKLRAEGDINGREFTSKPFGFKIEHARGAGWTIKLVDLNPGETVVLENSKTSARVGVIAMNGQDESLELAKRVQGALAGRYSEHKLITSEPKALDLEGYPAYELEYTGKEKATDTGNEQVRKAPQHMRTICLATVDKIYIIKLQADEDKWEACRKDLEESLKSFRVLAAE